MRFLALAIIYLAFLAGNAVADTRVFSPELQVVKSGVAANTKIGTLPAGYAIRNIWLKNTTANAVTGLAVGTTNGGVDIMAGVAFGANAVSLPIAPLIGQFSGAQDVYLNATLWNGASVNVTITTDYVSLP